MHKLIQSLQTLTLVAGLMVTASTLRADDPPPTPEDLERMQAVEEFTKKQIAANYPEKFKQAAEEFGVPVEILMGISFAETRMEHLTWPEGEKFSPENGMPRPYGIMSLWDNEYFGHSLTDAAKLINKSPEELMKDPLQNIRGAAALLKKLYGESDKPGYAKPDSLESWKYAIVKYCGIEEPDLSHQHAFDVYDWLSQGYDQYGIQLPQVPDLNVHDMWEETKKIKEEQRKINEAKWRAEGRMDDVVLEEFQAPDGMWYSRPASNQTAGASAASELPGGDKEKPKAAAPVAATTGDKQSGLVWGAVIAVVVIAIGALAMRKKPAAGGKK